MTNSRTGAAGSADVVASGLATRLRQLRRAHGLSQRKLATLLGLSAHSGVADYEAGRRIPPDDILIAYERHFRVPAGQLRQLRRRALAERASGEADADTSRTADLPSGAAPPVPRQLPACAADFTGRQAELGTLDALLNQSRDPATLAVPMLTISGMPGVGKTTLAVYWGHRNRHEFPDGHLYGNLRGHSPGPPKRAIEVLAQLLHALGVRPENVPADVDEAAGLYRSLLAGRRLLLILDNAANVEQVRPLLPGSSGCVVLVTSRNQLTGLVAHDHARPLALDVLTATEAGALLAKTLGADRVQAEPDAARELATLCAYLPLALRITAANLASRPGQRLADHVARLRQDNRLAALESVGDSTSAVHAAFQLSYINLTAREQRLFRLLGLAPGVDITAEAVAALADTTPGEAEEMLDLLRSAHLLGAPTPGRYALHDLLRLYASQRAAAEDDEHQRALARERLYGFYLHSVDAAAHLLYRGMLRLPTVDRPPGRDFTDRSQALAWLDAELPNLAAAVVDAAQHGPHQPAWLIADALRGYFWLRGAVVEWVRVASAGLRCAEAEDDPAARGAAQFSLGDAYERQSEQQRAIDHYRNASALVRQGGWTAAEPAMLASLGGIYLNTGQYQEAEDSIGHALVLFRRTGQMHGQAAALNNLGVVAWEVGRLAGAVEYLTESAAIHRQAESSYGEAIALGNLGKAYHALGRLDRARQCLDQSLELSRDIGNKSSEMLALNSLAEMHSEAHQLTLGRQLAEASLTLARDLSDRLRASVTLRILGAISQELGEHDDALDNCREALDLAREVSSRYNEVLALLGLAELYRRFEGGEQASSYAQLGLTISRRRQFRMLEGQALTLLAAIDAERGLPGEASRLARQALAVHRETGHRLGEGRSLAVLGEVARGTEGVDAATVHWRAALPILSEVHRLEADRLRALLAAQRPDDVAVAAAGPRIDEREE